MTKFIDIDYTLWDDNAKWWIIDKNDPSKCIKKINTNEVLLILSNFHINDDIPIYYNGIEGYISKDLYNSIYAKKRIDPVNIGLSDREFKDPDYIQKQLENFIAYSKQLDIYNDKDDYYLITKRGNKKAHEELLNNIAEELKINIIDEYFINDNEQTTNAGSIDERKILILLQHLIGYEINMNKIDSLLIKKYKTIDYYTDNINLEQYININNTLKVLLENSPYFIQEKIKSYLKLNEVYLNINILTSNTLNPFKVTKIKITVD